MSMLYPIEISSKDYINSVTVEVMITDKCNYSCEYCLNMKYMKYRKLKDINIRKLFMFLSYIHEMTKKNIQLVLMGGEPTLHHDFNDIIENANNLKYVHVSSFTNFSQKYSFYKNMILKGMSFEVSFHYGNDVRNFDFITKVKKLKKDNLLNNINIITVMLPYKNFDNCMKVFNKIEQICPEKVRCNLEVDNFTNNFDKKHFYSIKYSNEQLQQYNDTCYRSKINPIATVKMNDGSLHDFNDLQMKNKMFSSYKKWLCYAGYAYFVIDIDGNIFPCNSLKDKKLGNINECQYRLIHFKKTICCADSCSCEYNLPKVRIFQQHI